MTEYKMKYSYKNIQALRGIAVLLVMALHITAIEKKYSTDTLLSDFFQIGATGVDIFFLISGFIMATVTAQNRFGFGITHVLTFLALRALRIYPLYWLSTSAVLFFFTLIPSYTIALPAEKYFLLKSYLLLPQENLPLLSVGWTLVHELYFYLVFSLFLWFSARSRILLLIIWSIASCAGYALLKPSQEQPWLYILLNPLTLEFTTGCAIALLLQHWHPRMPHRIAISGALFALLNWTFWHLGNFSTFPVGGDRVIWFLAPCALLLIGIVSMEKTNNIMPGVLQKIGDASYSLYLTHVLILSAMGKIWQAFALPDNFADNALILPILLASALACGILCHRWIEKPLTTLTRKWILHGQYLKT